MVHLSALSLVALAAASASAAPAQVPGGKAVKQPSHFTSAFSTRAVPGDVIASTGSPAPGQPNAFGHFGFKINSEQDIICVSEAWHDATRRHQLTRASSAQWDIRTVNVTGEYQSPAVTATHIHAGVKGAAGPPR